MKELAGPSHKRGRVDTDFRKKGQLPRERMFGHLRERRHQKDISFEKNKREESRVFEPWFRSWNSGVSG